MVRNTGLIVCKSSGNDRNDCNPVNPADQTRNVYRKKPLEGSAYVQDKIEFETIVLNVGLRLDLFDPSTSYRSDPFDPASSGGTTMKSVLSPRLGIAYPVRDNMVFHFTYGQFFQRPEYQALYDNLDRTFSNRRTPLSPSAELSSTGTIKPSCNSFAKSAKTSSRGGSTSESSSSIHL